MRYLSIVHSRVALEDLTINGQLVRAGEHVLMNLPAGNWDAAFVDNPDTFDIDRTPRGHLSASNESWWQAADSNPPPSRGCRASTHSPARRKSSRLSATGDLLHIATSAF